MRCGKKKVWLDPNEINEIANTNSRKYTPSQTYSVDWPLQMLPICKGTLCYTIPNTSIVQFVTLLNQCAMNSTLRISIYCICVHNKNFNQLWNSYHYCSNISKCIQNHFELVLCHKLTRCALLSSLFGFLQDKTFANWSRMVLSSRSRW